MNQGLPKTAHSGYFGLTRPGISAMPGRAVRRCGFAIGLKHATLAYRRGTVVCGQVDASVMKW